MLEEVRRPEPPIRLAAVFFEPGPARQIAAELTALGEVVVAIGAPLTEGGGARTCDELLGARGVVPARSDMEAQELGRALAGLGAFEAPDHGREGPVPE